MKSKSSKVRPDAFPSGEPAPSGDGIDLPMGPEYCFRPTVPAPRGYAGQRVGLTPDGAGWAVIAVDGARLGTLTGRYAAEVERAGRSSTVASADAQQICLVLG